ncbi:MAG: hypothetical protein IIA45_01800 [Bacteroidetes bacterium]|nr:hypothetical protein [Bacteroidota bacterium]
MNIKKVTDSFKERYYLADMKKILTLILICCSFLTASSGIITIDGTYQGKKIVIQNPISSDQSFCITEVYINDIPYYEINNTAFEIRLSNIRIGEYMNIKIVYKDNCRPKIMNAGDLRSKSTYEVVSFKIDNRIMKWTTKNERNEEPFIIERLRNGKWVEIGKVIGKGPEGFNNYAFDVNHYSGTNTYRIKQRSLQNKYRYSEEVEYYSNKAEINFYPKRVATEIYLSEKTEYEIYDSFGLLILKGEAREINVAELESGVYYLNIDNRTEKFLKK